MRKLRFRLRGLRNSDGLLGRAMTLLLSAVLALCSRHELTVTVQNMHGADVQYTAPYYICEGEAEPSNPNVIPIGHEDGNPFGRVVWTYPFLLGDVQWLTKAPY